MPSCYQIQRFQLDEFGMEPDPSEYEDVEIFREAPAPHVTLYGRILSLNYQFPPWQHVWHEIECPPE